MDRKQKSASKHTSPETSVSKTNDVYVLPNLERWLFQISLFLIPTNLWLGFYKQSASVHGIIVDYLIPKLYLSDLVLGLLLVLWVLRHHSVLLKKLLTSQSLLIGAATVGIVCFSALQSMYTLASFWFLLKIIQIVILCIWAAFYQPSLRWYTKPLMLAVVFQSLIGLVQWLQKSSLVGYLLLGESTLRISTDIAKTSIGGELRPLPYGTTPHPNILAGFIAVSLVTLLTIRKLYPDPKPKSPLLLFKDTLCTLVMLGLSVATLLLTQSLSAIVGLVAGIVFLGGQHFHRQNLMSIIAIIVALSLFALPMVDEASITRRVQLAQAAISMTLDHPFFGIGPNAFSSVISQYAPLPGPNRFLQPVHNIFLLWIAETSLVGLPLLLWVFWQLRLGNIQLAAPLVVLMIIGLFDHYPLSLQTGQLMVWLSISLIFYRNPQQSASKSSPDARPAAK